MIKYRVSQMLLLVSVLSIITPVVYAQPSSDFPVEVIVTGTGFSDTFLFADHTNDLNEGNWIVLSGGTNVALPAIVMTYNGITSTSYEKNGKTIAIETLNVNGKTVTYPLTTHPVYSPAQSISYAFKGHTNLQGKAVSVRVIPVSVTDFKDAASDAFNGDTALMKSILGSAVVTQPKTLDSNGDIATTSIGTLIAGDYLLVIVKETPGNPYTLEVYSATPIEVLDYASAVTALSSVTRGTALSITTQLTGAGAGSRIYGAVMIQKTKYSVNLALTSDGTTLGTELTGRGVVLIEGTADGFSIAGVGLSGIDKDELVSKLNEAYNGDEFSVAFSSYTANTQQTVQLTTTGLTTGTYVVLVGVWEGSGDKLVAFHQREVTVSAPYAPPPSGPGPTPPAPSISSLIQAMGDVEAATALMAMSPATAAGIMSQITAQKAASIMSMMPTANAVAIVNEMQAQAAAAVMNVAENGVVVRVLAAMDPAKAAAILGEMTVDKVARVLEEAVNAGKVAQFSAYMNMLDKSRAAEILLEISPEAGVKIVDGMAQDNLQEAAKRVEAAVKLSLGETDPVMAQQLLLRIAAILDKVDTGALVDIFIEIANLPETPSTVATVLEAMDTAKVLEVVSTWIGTGSLDELAEVFSSFSDSFLSEVWRGMSSSEKSILFTYLSSETVQRLPEVGEFQLSALQVSPATVSPGQSVTISVVVENVGPDPAVYTVVLKIDGVTEQTRKVSMSLGEKQTTQWTVSRSEVKVYNVEVNQLAGSFTVQPVYRPAAFTLSNLAVSPSTVEPGVSVMITVSVRNTGMERGSTSVELKVDGVTEESVSVTLRAKESVTVVFMVSRSVEGSYTVAVGSLTGSFTVTAPEPPPPGIPWIPIVIAIVIISIIGYVIYDTGSRKPMTLVMG